MKRRSTGGEPTKSSPHNGGLRRSLLSLARSPALLSSRPILLVLAGPLLFLGIFFILPLTWIVYVSAWPEGQFDVSSYAQIATSTVYRSSFVWTFQLALVTAVTTLLLGYPVAYAMTSAGPKLRFFLLLCIIIPFWTSALVRAFSWTAILGRQGVVNSALQASGLTDQPIQLVFNSTGAIIGTTHVMMPFMVLCLYANMQRIDLTVLRAAESLGASRIRAFFLVYVPQTLSGLMSGFVLVFILSLGFFVTPAVLGGSQVQTLSVLIEQTMSRLLDWSLATALATVLLGLTLLSYGLFRHQISGAFGHGHDRSGVETSVYKCLSLIDGWLRVLRSPADRSAGRRGASNQFGRQWRFGSTKIIAVLIGALTAFPIMLIVLIAFFPSYSMRVDFSNFSLRWFRMYFGRIEWLSATLTSFEIAAGCAVLTSVLALASAFAMRRMSVNGRALLIPLYLSPMIVPGLVYGLAAYMVFAAIGLVGTKLALILAHTVLAIPAAFLLMLAGVQSLDERLEDAAASLGASPWRQFRYVSFPLLAPIALVGALVAFLISFDDINVALFLASGSARTLPKLMYDSIVFESDPRVTAASAVLVGITVVALTVIYGLRARASKKPGT